MHGPLLVVVDQPATITPLPVAVARAAGLRVACLPGLAMRRFAGLHPVRANADARDAFIIAAARSLPRTPAGRRRRRNPDRPRGAGFDDDLAGEATWISNRIRGLLADIHSGLERAIGPKISHPEVLEILLRCGGPASFAKAGRRKLTAIAKIDAPRMGERLVEAIMIAPDGRAVTVPGTAAADTVLPRLADSMKTARQQRKQVAEQVERKCAPAASLP